MTTKVNDTVFDGTNPRVSDLDVTNFDATNGTVQTDATTGKQIVNYDTMFEALKLAVPAGVVVPFAGSSVPSTDWILCDGQAVDSVSNPQYAPLYAAIGTTYGGTGANNFNVPDLRGRVVAALDNMGGMAANRISSAQADILGGDFGDDEITLSDAQMPSHDHNVGISGNTGSGSPHTHTGTTGGSGAHSHSGWWESPSSTGASGDNKNVQDRFGSRSGGNHTHTMNLDNESAHVHSLSGASISESTRGSDAPHNNVQPTMFMNYIIKAT